MVVYLFGVVSFPYIDLVRAVVILFNVYCVSDDNSLSVVWWPLCVSFSVVCVVAFSLCGNGCFCRAFLFLIM